MSRRKKQSKGLKANLKFELYGIVILTLSIIALSREGSVARSLTYLFRFMIGTWDFIVPSLFYLCRSLCYDETGMADMADEPQGRVTAIVLALSLMSHISLFAQLYPKGQFTAGQIMSQTWNSMVNGLSPSGKGQAILTYEVGGGIVGAALYSVLYFLFSQLGAKLIQYMLFIAGFTLMTGWSLTDVFAAFKRS